VWGGEAPLALEPWWPLRSPSQAGAVEPLSPSTRKLLSLLPSHSPSLVALITLHVPCPFNLATKGRQAGEAGDSRP